MNKVVVCFVMTISVFFLFDVVDAHKVIIISWFQGDFLHIESKFDGGDEVRNGDIEILDSNGSIVFNGKTDHNGHFVFKIKQIDDLKIVLSTPCGHKNHLMISKNEILDAKQSVKNDINDSIEDIIIPSEMNFPTLAQIEIIVSRQLDSKLRPISRALARCQQRKNKLHDILGGIGYIIGLVGLITYFKSRYI